MMAELNLLELGLDWKLAIQRVAKDVRDDFWTDPLVFTDLLGSGDTDSSRLEPLLKSYRPRQGFSYCIPKANFTIRDSIHISALDRIVYQGLVIQSLSPSTPAFPLTSSLIGCVIRPRSGFSFRSEPMEEV